MHTNRFTDFFLPLLFIAYGKVFLTRKTHGSDEGQLYAMKVLKKATIVQKRKTTEHTKTERQVLQTIRQSPFLVTMHYAFQTSSKLHLVLGKKGQQCAHTEYHRQSRQNFIALFGAQYEYVYYFNEVDSVDLRDLT